MRAASRRAVAAVLRAAQQPSRPIPDANTRNGFGVYGYGRFRSDKAASLTAAARDAGADAGLPTVARAVVYDGHGYPGRGRITNQLRTSSRPILTGRVESARLYEQPH